MSIGSDPCSVEDCDTPYERRRNCEHCGDVVCWPHLTNFCNVCCTQEYPFTFCGGHISTVCPDCADDGEEELPEGETRASLHGYCDECEREEHDCRCY